MWKKASEFTQTECVAFKPLPFHDTVEVAQIQDVRTNTSGETYARLRTRSGDLIERCSADRDDMWELIDTDLYVLTVKNGDGMSIH